MMNFILGALLLALMGAAVHYVVKAKKNGTKCIGCPDGGCGCGCGKH